MILKSLIFGTLCISLSCSYDPERSDQWYYNDNERVSLHVEGAWRKDYGGQGVVVGVVDSGISDSYVADLQGQVIAHYSKTGNTIHGSVIGSRGHGTKTAGVISMLKDNNECGVGIAPEAKLIDIAAFFDGNPTDYQKSVSQVVQLTSSRNNVDIYTNSWGSFDGGMTMPHIVSYMKDNLDRGTQEGRSRKGAIYLWASGNGGQNGDSCSYDGYVNNLNVAAVTGMTRSGQKLTSGESCPGIMAAAPSTNGEQTSSWWGGATETIDGIVTTDESSGCTDNFPHSSVAPPMAAGVVALALEANPNLGWRDVHHLMAYTSNPCAAASQSSFITNGAGFKVSDTFGFGLLNAEEMVTAAERWSPVGSRLKCTASKSGSSIRFRSSDISCQGQNIEFMEHVLVKVRASASGYRGRILATLRSPAGTSSRILPGRTQDLLPLGLDDWQVKAVTFWGEAVEGTWSLDFQGVGSVSNVDIEFYGLAWAPSYSGSKQRCPGTSVTASPTSARWTTTRSSSGDCTYVSHNDQQCSVTCGTGVATRYTTCRDSFGREYIQVSQVACQEQSCSSSASCSYSVLTLCSWNPSQNQYTQTARKSCPGQVDSVVVTVCN